VEQSVACPDRHVSVPSGVPYNSKPRTEVVIVSGKKVFDESAVPRKNHPERCGYPQRSIGPAVLEPSSGYDLKKLRKKLVAPRDSCAMLSPKCLALWGVFCARRTALASQLLPGVAISVDAPHLRSVVPSLIGSRMPDLRSWKIPSLVRRSGVKYQCSDDS
jgi:hypothetical protein